MKKSWKKFQLHADVFMTRRSGSALPMHRADNEELSGYIKPFIFANHTISRWNSSFVFLIIYKITATWASPSPLRFPWSGDRAAVRWTKTSKSSKRKTFVFPEISRKSRKSRWKLLTLTQPTNSPQSSSCSSFSRNPLRTNFNWILRSAQAKNSLNQNSRRSPIAVSPSRL